jgi:phage terminase large subunit-like protein
MTVEERLEQHIYYSNNFQGSLTDQLIEYCSRILDGRIIACTKHKWACQRLLNDLDKQKTEDFPYYFDEAEALKAINWMEEFKHSKGELAGTKIKAHIFTKFTLGNIYGWININTGYRRFKRMYEQVGRKNAKSQTLAAMGSYELIPYKVAGAEVYCLAPISKQAKAVFNEAITMLEGHKVLRRKVKIKRSTNEIIYPKNNCRMTIFTREDLRNGDSYNPQFACIDEYHLFDTSEGVDVMESGMGARYNPLIAIITTAGRKIFCPCKEEYDHCSKIINPYVEIYDDKKFVIICEVEEEDDPFDILSLVKANPIVSTYKTGLENLMEKLQIAKDREDKRVEYFTKQCNIWVNQKQNKPYMNMEKWSKCKVDPKKKPMPKLEGLTCVVGIDKSDKIDLTSVTYEFLLGGENVLTLNQSYIPADTLKAKMKSDKVPYDLWVNEGHIISIPGAKILDDYIVQDVLEFKRQHNFILDSVAYDPWHCEDIAKKFQDEGITTIEIPQTYASLSEPTKDFRAKVYSGEVLQDGNPVLSYCFSNAVEDKDRKENLKLWKEKKDSERIDAAVSTIISHVRVYGLLNGGGETFYSPEN